MIAPRWASAFVAALAVTGLAGCTVPVGSVTAMSVDAEGAPVAVLVVCKGSINGVTVYTGSGADEVTVGSWSAPEPITDSVVLDLAAPASGWSPRAGLEPLTPGVGYTLYGWTEDNEWSAGHIEFAVEDLADLDTTDVFFEDYDEKSQRWRVVTVPREEFIRTGCDDYQ